jgi:hypothetical protein
VGGLAGGRDPTMLASWQALQNIQMANNYNYSNGY